MARFDYILHRADGVTTVELNSQVGTFRAVTSERLTAVRQDVSSAELTLISSEAFTVNVGDWIQAKGIRLYCMSTIDRYTCSEDNNREYQLTFYDPIYYLRQAIFYNTSENENEGVYSYSRVDNTYPSVGTFEDFVKLCCYNCNSVQGVRLFKVGTISEDIATDIRVITFSDYNCLAVLKQSCESFETTWRVRVNEDVDPDSVFIIDFGVAIDDFPVTLKVEHSQGLTSIDVTASDKDVYTQFVIKGGSENLPSDYPYPNLQLDEDLSGTPQVLVNSMIKLPDLYSRWGKSIKELTYEDIKPSRTGTVTSISENILKFTDSDLIGAAWSPVGGTIHFVSGHLIGFTFNCQDFNSATGEITIESTEESNGFILPSPTDSYYRINELDKYNIAGVSLPSSYITAAKTALKERALLGIDYWSQPRMQYAITIDPKIISVEIVPNMGFHIEHSALGIDKVINVQQVVYDLSKESPYDIESILISDLKTDDSKADSTHRQVATNRNIVNGTGANNVYSAKLLSRQRILDDYAKSQGLPNWGTFMEILSSGKGLWKDEDGNWWLNVAAIKAGAIGAELINATQLIANEVFINGVKDTAGNLDDAIQVGGRNYWAISKNPWHSYLVHQGDGVFTNNAVYSSFAIFSMYKLGVPVGETYTVSFEINVSDDSIQFLNDTFYVNGATPSTTHNKPTLVKDKWVKVYATFNYTAESTSPVHIYINGIPSINTFQIRNFKLEKGNKPTDWTPAPEDVQAEIDANASALSDFEGVVTTSISGLQAQIDGVVDSWFYAYTPTTANYPASEWTTTELKQRHVGDTFTNTQAYVDEATTPDAGKSWRWVENSGVYSWTSIADSDAVKALLAASTAQDTADGKRRVFTTTPTTPYDKGDLWPGGTSGDLKISTTTRAVGSSYVAGDWVLATKYTDDTVANAAAAAAAAAQSAADDAQDDADAANALLTNIASDSKLTASEKQAAQKEWDIIQAEKTKNDTQADLYSVSKTVYTNAYNALSSYLSTLLSNLTTTSNITGSEFRGKFKDYYNARTDLLNAISNAAKAAAEATAAALDAAIQVGGRNLLKDTKAEVRNTNYPLKNYYLGSVKPQEGEQVTIMFRGALGTGKVYFALYNSGGSVDMCTIDNTNKGADGIYRKTFNWIISTASNTHLSLYPIPSYVAAESWVAEMMLVIGNKVAYYSEAPEDVQAEIDAANAAAAAAVTTAASDATTKTNAAKDAIAQEAGYTNFADMESKAALTVNGLLNSQIINVDDLFANTAFISKLLLEDGFIENLTVKFLETVGDANGYKVQIENSLNSEGAGESYVRLVNSDGTRKAELVFDPNNVYGGSGGLPVLRITDNGCYSRVFAEGLEAVSTTSGRFSYNMISQFTPFGMVFATGTRASAAVKGGFTWNKDNGLVSIYANTLPRGAFGTVSEGFLYRSPDGLSNDLIRYQS